MTDFAQRYPPELEATFWRLYRDFFDQAERRRRWSVAADIPWQLPHDSHVAMLAYAMVQERATALNYRNLRRRAEERGGEPALEKLLMLVAVDEQAHHHFFLECVRLYLKHDPEGTLEHLRRV